MSDTLGYSDSDVKIILKTFHKNNTDKIILAHLNINFIWNKSDELRYMIKGNTDHCVKSVRIRSYSGPHFPAFGLNTDGYGVSFRIQSECGKMWTRITPNTNTFNAVDVLMISESKQENSFPDGEFLIEGYDAPFRLNRNKLGLGIMFFLSAVIFLLNYF